MANYSTVLNQLLHLIPRYNFECIVKSLGADRYVKTLKCWNQFTALLYAQASGKTSLREIIQGLEVNATKLYHLGMVLVKRSTLAEANQKRSHEIYERLFYKFVSLCKTITPKHKFRFKNPLYSYDATVIDLCLNIFPWAKYKSKKGALKMHCMLDHSGDIPDFIVITEGNVSETTIAKTEVEFKPDSIYCYDRACTDFETWNNIGLQHAYFVTKMKSNIRFKVTGQHTEKMKKGILSDERIRLKNKKYNKDLRMIRHLDMETGELKTFITNNFKLAPGTIVQIYETRWQIEIFFRWIKQNLKIKTFLGTSKNAVLTQIWIAMIYYLLLTYIKYQSKYGKSLYYLHRIIREALTARLSLLDLLRVTPSKIQDFKIKEFQHSFW